MTEDEEKRIRRARLLGWGLQCDLIGDGDIGRDIRLVAKPDGQLDFAAVEGVNRWRWR
jgi:hypothetical protein